jgi:hypothetical protein
MTHDPIDRTDQIDRAAEVIVNMTEGMYEPMELLGRMADWGPEEWAQVDEDMLWSPTPAQQLLVVAEICRKLVQYKMV